MKKLLLIICGSIAAPKALKLYELLQKKYHITLICTPSAFKFVQFPANLKIYHQFLAADFYHLDQEINHVEFGWTHDLIVVYPATMNFISKVASAIPDTLALATILASQQPKLLFPAMNSNMYLNSAFQSNLLKLQQDPMMTIIEPETGELAEKINGKRLVGIGRLQDPTTALKLITKFEQTNNCLKGKTILINYGATRSYLDEVRFLTTKSSGKMGHSLIISALKFGAKVIAIGGDVNETMIYHPNLTIETAFTNETMLKLMTGYLKTADIIISAASLNDFQFETVAVGKIKKRKQRQITVNLIPQIDVLTELIQQKKQQCFIAFSAQDQFDWSTGIKKMTEKNCDGIIINPFEVAGTTTTTIKFYFQGKKYQFDGSKIAVAEKIMAIIAKNYHK